MGLVGLTSSVACVGADFGALEYRPPFLSHSAHAFDRGGACPEVLHALNWL